jgi:hypothetical protein
MKKIINYLNKSKDQKKLAIISIILIITIVIPAITLPMMIPITIGFLGGFF